MIDAGIENEISVGVAEELYELINEIATLQVNKS